MKAGRVGIEETIRPIMCSTTLSWAILSAWVECERGRRGQWFGLLQLHQVHDNDGLIRLLGLGDLVG